MRTPARLTVIAVAAALSLTACARPVPATPLAVAPTLSPTLAPPTEAPSAIPTATPSATPTSTPSYTPSPRPTFTATPTPSATATPPHPLDIVFMRNQSYPGSELVFEETLTPGPNYDRFIVSYRSEGLKIFAYMTVPRGERPATGWPVVIFNHGYIPPEQYRSTERYVAYVDAFARRGYIVFRSDYRGHGFSEGEARGGSGSADYTVDVLNGMASVKRLADADPDRIGMWGHSMGGGITLRAMVLTDEIRAGVIWAGTVAPYPELLERYLRRTPAGSAPTNATPRPGRRWAQEWIEQYGSPQENPAFWEAISANAFLADLSGPMALHHGTTDASVPVDYSIELAEQIEAVGQPVELYTYEGDDHNIARNWGLAMTRSVNFMDEHVKGNGAR